MSFFSSTAAVCPSDLLRRAKEASGSVPKRFALAGAESVTALEGASALRNAGLGVITLVGDASRIRALSRQHKLSLHAMDIHDCASDAASVEATRLARSGEVQVVMKGSVKTDGFMRALLNRDYGVRVIGKRMVHIFYITPPSVNDKASIDNGGLLLSDCAVNVSPDEATKREALSLMAYLGCRLGFARPRLAILSASEQEMDSLPSSLSAGRLARWGQEHLGDIADIAGPLSFDVALVQEAAAIKGVRGAVAGRANGLLLSEIETGNALFKALVWIGGGCAAGIVMGGLVPIVLTSRADSAASRLASAALALVAASEPH